MATFQPCSQTGPISAYGLENAGKLLSDKKTDKIVPDLMAKKFVEAKTGKEIGRYRIERELGRGGMGVVYLARDQTLDRMVALKTTSVSQLGGRAQVRNQRRQRFVREVKALSNVNHSNVVHVFDAGEEDDPELGWVLYYTMEFVEGNTISDLVRQYGALDAGVAAAICQQVSAGLGSAHESGIVHRDVKPANIFVSPDGRALIGDFGICKIEGGTQITRRDQLVGTPSYLSPEQILGDTITPASDVFAVGALFFVIATNSPLRPRLDAQGLMNAARGDEARDMALQMATVPDGLRKVIARALERDPAKRWVDGTVLADALAAYASRIPPLDAGPDAWAAKALPRSTAHNPFGGGGGEDGAGGPAPVTFSGEEADDDDDAEDLAPEGGDVEALPEARTESTVMFNMRAYEERRRAEEALKAEEEAKAKAGDWGDEEGDGFSAEMTDPVVRKFDADAAMEAQRDDNTSAVASEPFQIKLWMVAAVAAGAALLGALLVVLLVGGDDDKAGPPSVTQVQVSNPAENIEQNLPAACRKKSDSEFELTESSRLVDEAMDLKSQGKEVDAIRTLDQAVAMNPRNTLAHFQLARLLSARKEFDKAKIADACVVALAPDTKEAQLSKKSLAIIEALQEEQ
jgi:tetratricopeptide (TPR) repeat protein/predicted Ser/Thr protein kinase